MRADYMQGILYLLPSSSKSCILLSSLDTPKVCDNVTCYIFASKMKYSVS